MSLFWSNILTQICALGLVVTMLVFYFMRKKIKHRSGDNCIQLVIVMLVCTILDIMSVFVIIMARRYPGTIVEKIAYLECRTYLASIVAVTGFGIRYICSDMCKSEKTYKTTVRIVAAAILAEIVALYILPVKMVLDGRGPYTSGTATLSTYGIVAFNLVVMVYFIHRSQNNVNNQRLRADYFCVVVWVVSAIIQFFFPVSLVVSFGGALGTAIIFFALENPEANLSRSSGLFNEGALALYCDQHYFTGKKFSLIYATYSGVLGFGNITINRNTANEINKYLEEIRGAKVFKLGDAEFIVAVEDDNAKDIYNLIQDRFNYGWGEKKNIMLSMQYVYVPNAMICSNWEKLSQAINSAEHLLLKGKNQVIITEELLKQFESEFEIEEILSDAIENNRIEVFYQPIYSVKKGYCHSAEALVRIRREDGSIVPPGLFIPVAEKNGTIVKIGEIVFEQVCRFLQSEALNERFDVDYIEVNLSVVQCAYEGLADSFIGIMDRCHIRPSWINLEITESESLKSKEILLKNMDELIKYGVSFSLDDFGTGQSNLNYVMDMPVRFVKFDREMTKAFFERDNARHIMSSSIKMLRELDLEIVVEGIETKEQLDEMCKYDVSFIQGFYFSKPLPAKEYLAFLEEKKWSGR
ncbi:MAG: EAL domain-containing protein [Lachnospiraceae bacterium]|nr:EAL domain-containing protein [Lachnospiraceae bacterium]